MQDFEDIRPYKDEEVHQVLLQLTEHPRFQQLLGHFYPPAQATYILEGLQKLHSIHEFQAFFIHPGLRSIYEKTTNGITWEGYETLDADHPSLFLSNHRDIILDSAILNVLLFEYEYPTSHIAIGNNLLKVSDLVSHLVKLNRSFIVQRDVSAQHFYETSLRLSTYIRQVLTQEKNSVWLAQKNGRTKDGNDRTQSALLKMLAMSATGDFEDAFSELNIRPMSISYEFEPCDFLKARELYYLFKYKHFEKKPGDDKASIISGIQSQKGRIHLALTPSLNPELPRLGTIRNKNERIKLLCGLIDQAIHRHYRLWPNNFVACDLMAPKPLYEDHYQREDRERFVDHVENLLVDWKGDVQSMKVILWEMYAQPVRNAEAAGVVFEV